MHFDCSVCPLEHIETLGLCEQYCNDMKDWIYKDNNFQQLVTVHCKEYDILRCPNCNVNLAVVYKDNSRQSVDGIGDIPPVASHCKFCGQAIKYDE